MACSVFKAQGVSGCEYNINNIKVKLTFVLCEHFWCYFPSLKILMFFCVYFSSNTDIVDI